MYVTTGSKLVFGDALRYIDENGAHLRIRNSETGGDIQLNAKNDMSFYIDGAQKMHIDTSGKVGVGLTNPQSFSDAFSVQIDSNSGWPIAFTNAAEDVTGALRTDQGDNYIALASKTASDIRFFYNDAEANTSLIIKGAGALAGNVGIGTTSPSRKLHVVEGSNGYAARFEDGIELDGTNVQLLGYGQGNLWLMGNSGNPKLTLGYSHNWDFAVSLQYIRGATGGSSYVGDGELKIGQLDKNNANWDHGITSFYVSGSEAMRLNKDGYLGIGTTAPDKPLVVRTGGTRDFKFFDYDMTYESSLGIRAKNGGYLGLVTEGANDVFISTNGFANKRLVAKSDGKIGIGTVTPDRLLHLSSAGTTFMKFTSDDTQDWSIGANSTAGFAIYDETDSLYRFCVKDGGNVGIGTTTPDYTLELENTAPQLGFNDTNGRKFYLMSQSDKFWLGDATGGTTPLVVDSAGDVGIGTTNPIQPLHVVTSANDKGILIDVSDNTHEGRLIFGDVASNGIGHIGYNHALDAMRFNVAGTEVMRATSNTLTVTGTISATAKSFNIPHPLYKDKRLVHGSLEGPEHGIYIRGTIETEEKGCLIELPEYWSAMCEDYTVQLTPHGPYTVYIKEKLKDKVMIECSQKKFKFDYYIVGARTDETLEVVQDGE